MEESDYTTGEELFHDSDPFVILAELWELTKTARGEEDMTREELLDLVDTLEKSPRDREETVRELRFIFGEEIMDELQDTAKLKLATALADLDASESSREDAAFKVRIASLEYGSLGGDPASVTPEDASIDYDTLIGRE